MNNNVSWPRKSGNFVALSETNGTNTAAIVFIEDSENDNKKNAAQ